MNTKPTGITINEGDGEMTNDEQVLNEADAKDDAAFDAQWSDWSIRHALQDRELTDDQLRVICKIWFGRGIAVGTQWGMEAIDRAFATGTKETIQ